MGQSSEKFWGRIISIFVLLSFLLVFLMGSVWAAPPGPHPHPGRIIGPPGPHPHPGGIIGPPAPWKIKGPPPPGMVWFNFRGSWVSVPPPPGHGPYLWDGGAWVIDSTPPPSGSEWVPGRWSDDGWIAGHWLAIPEPAPGHVWVEGHWKEGVWIQGHWKGSSPPGKNWVPGHHGPRGRWIPGHYR